MATRNESRYISESCHTGAIVAPAVAICDSRLPMTATFPEPRDPLSSSPWTFLTNHAHVLLAIARNRHVRLREIAVQVGITERAVQKIIAELELTGVLTKFRNGRRNHYQVHANAPLRHPRESHLTVASFVRLLHDDVTLGSDTSAA